jgi:AraC family transcriptional regulator
MIRTIITAEEKSVIRLSSYNKFEGVTAFNELAVKVVLSGKEIYLLDGKTIEVGAGEFIIGNNEKTSEVLIKENTIGVCLDISQRMVTEVIATFFQNDDFNEFITTDQLLINKYRLSHTNLHSKIRNLSLGLFQSELYNMVTEEFFYEIAEGILRDQAKVFESLSKLNYKNKEVSYDVFRSIYRAKEYIDDQFLMPIHLDDLAEIAHISKFSFIRLFKLAFGYSPYQYILHKRLQYGADLLKAGQPVSSIAEVCGFSDLHAFSKAFKGKFKVSPTRFSV